MEMCAELSRARECKSFVGFVQVLSDSTTKTLNSIALVAFPLHVSLPNCSAVYWRRLAENEVTLVRFFLANMDSIMESELRGEGTGEGAHYCHTRTEEDHVEEGMLPLG